MLRFIVRAILAIASLVFFIIFGVRSCASYEYPRPSEAFYVSDFADMFGPSLENFLLSNSEEVYETFKDEPEVGGMQIVFATFVIEDEGELGNINKRDLFNEWKVGKNEMGLMASFYFVPIAPREEGNFYLTEVQIETGDDLAVFINTIDLRVMQTNTVDHHIPHDQPTYSYDYDLALGVATFMNEILNVAYGEIYGQPEDVIPQAEFEEMYEEYFDSYSGGSSFNTTDSMNLFSYFFSSFGSLGDKLLFGTFLFAFTLASGVAIKGAGGGSSGAGLFHHR